MGIKISAMTAVTAANLDDTALVPVVDKNGASRKATIGQVRTQLGNENVVTKAFADTPYAVSGTDQTILVDTSGGNVTVTLPAAPLLGRKLNIKKVTTDGNTLTIARNGKKIENTAADLTTASAARPNYTLQYDSTAGSWWVL